MNNDKRIILAIALYAAVMTMVLHTLTSEGHERFNASEEHAYQENEKECTNAMDISEPFNGCSEDDCVGSAVDNGAATISKFVKENPTSLEVDDNGNS